MPKVTSEMMLRYIDEIHFPVRHKKGCPKNYARMLPMLYLARGMSFEETKAEVEAVCEELVCKCGEL